jgi:hypothetical protein
MANKIGGMCGTHRGEEKCTLFHLDLFCIICRVHLNLSIGPFPLSFPTTWTLVRFEVFTAATVKNTVFCDVSLPRYTQSRRGTEQS